MNILLDTSVVIWLMCDLGQINSRVLDTLIDKDNVLYLSSISAWEIYQKHTIKKLELPDEPLTMVKNICHDYQLNHLPFLAEHCAHLGKLPPIHRDPFDRMLICQAIQNNLTIVTPDKDIRQYPIKTLW